jgi:hypothetical protein
MKKADLIDMSKNASKSVYTSTAAVFPDTLSLTPLTSSDTVTPGNTALDPDDPKPADEGDI